MKVDVRILVVFFLVALAASSFFSAATAQPMVESAPAAEPAEEEPLGDAPVGGTIRGMVYEDLNGNGFHDEGEPGVEGAIVELQNGFRQPLASQQTGLDGRYSFTDLSPGSYCLQEVDPPGFDSEENAICFGKLVVGQVIEHNFGDVRLVTPTATETPQVSPIPTSTYTPGPTATSTVSPTPTPESWLDPGNAVTVYCQGVFWGDTTDKPNRAEQYGTVPWMESGPEDMYILHKTVTSDLTVTIDGVNGQDMDIFLLSAPYPENLVEDGYGDKRFTVRNLPPGTYYIIVDGYQGDMGPYRLAVYCEGEPTVTPTPTLSPTPTNTPFYSYEPLIIQQPTPTPTPIPTMVPYQQAVNCGSEVVYVAKDGHTYVADRAFSAGAWGWQGGGADKVWAVYPADRDIVNTADDPLYREHRHSMDAYHFTVPNGQYEVLLRFAEIFPYVYPGDRVFAVDIEGQRVLDHLDMLVVSTKYGAWDGKYQVDVTDGLLTISFVAQSSHYTPAISAIRVVRVG